MHRMSNALVFFSVSLFLLVNHVTASLDAEGIVGGDWAAERQFKYLVSLQVDGDHVCGAGIIDDQYVLTAAHCVLNGITGLYQNDYAYYIVAGIADLNSTTNRIQVEVEEIYTLLSYSPAPISNDIAVLKLKRGLGLGSDDRLSKLQFSGSDHNYPGSVAVIAGFGANGVKTSIGPVTGIKYDVITITSSRLKFADVRIIDNDSCRKMKIKQSSSITNKMICGQVHQRSHDQPEGICIGDSGSPLVVGNTVVGIVSTSPHGCVEDKEPAIYTRVSSYWTFIYNSMRGVLPPRMIRVSKVNHNSTTAV